MGELVARQPEVLLYVLQKSYIAKWCLHEKQYLADEALFKGLRSHERICPMAFLEVPYVDITTGRLEHPFLLYKEKAMFDRLHILAPGPCLVKLREASSKESLMSLVFCRQVYKAKDNETEEIVALKKVRMDNEKEGVGVPLLLLAIAVPTPADVAHRRVTNVRILSSPFAIMLVEHDGGA
jgi:hypothetical protein